MSMRHGVIVELISLIFILYMTCRRYRMAYQWSEIVRDVGEKHNSDGRGVLQISMYQSIYTCTSL